MYIALSDKDSSVDFIVPCSAPHMLHARYTNQKLWYKGVRGATRKLLPQNYITLFANKQIVCVEYENLTEDQEREMFQVRYPQIQADLFDQCYISVCN